MGDHERESEPEQCQERWRALRAALDRAGDPDDGDDAADETDVDLSESEPLDVEIAERASRADETPSEAFGTSSPRVLTVDLADEFAGLDRDRRGPVLTVGDGEDGD